MKEKRPKRIYNRAAKQPAASFELREDQRKVETACIIAKMYECLSQMDDLYDLFKVDDHKRTIESFKVEMIRTAITEQRGLIYCMERVYSQIGIAQILPILDNEQDS
jgi:hypothetical protein